MSCDQGILWEHQNSETGSVVVVVVEVVSSMAFYVRKVSSNNSSTFTYTYLCLLINHLTIVRFYMWSKPIKMWLVRLLLIHRSGCWIVTHWWWKRQETQLPVTFLHYLNLSCHHLQSPLRFIRLLKFFTILVLRTEMRSKYIFCIFIFLKKHCNRCSFPNVCVV